MEECTICVPVPKFLCFAQHSPEASAHKQNDNIQNRLFQPPQQPQQGLLYRLLTLGWLYIDYESPK